MTVYPYTDEADSIPQIAASKTPKIPSNPTFRSNNHVLFPAWSFKKPQW